MLQLRTLQMTTQHDYREWAQSDPDARPVAPPEPMVERGRADDDRRADQSAPARPTRDGADAEPASPDAEP